MPASLLIRPPSTSAQLAAARPIILQDLDRLDEYPMFSETTIWAMAMVNNPNISLAEVAILIRRDPVIAAAVLRRANDATYGSRRAIDSVQQAVVRVGLQECGKLLCLMGMRAVFNRHPEAVQERCDEVHRHSLLVAHLAGEINRGAALGFGGVEFTAGLLHDIGRVILYVKCPPDATAGVPTSLAGEDILSVERARFGIDHCAAGHLLAQRNGLPEQLQEAILHHHRPESAPQSPLVALVSLANQIANHVQREHNITAYTPTACHYFRVLARDWTSQRQTAFTRSLPDIVVRAMKATRAMLKSFD
jgi:putative nucleotidyltransferase with HDIG domain